MSVSEILLKKLRCPACLGELELKTGGEALKCRECHRVYPIRDEIPIMLVDEAIIEEPETV
ncbi:MAG: Trm112 family protein [Blastocatellales bacterium]|mgnify:CR=1 FL=1